MPDTPVHDDPTPDPPTDASGESSLRRWGRRAGRIGGGLLLTVLVLIGLVLVILQTETGATAAVQYLAPRINPVPNSELTVERASGNWLQSLKLTNVSLTRTDTTSGTTITMAHLDTLSARYDLGALLRGRIHVTDAVLRSPTITMRQAPDSTWDWIEAFRSPNDTTTAPGRPIQIDRVRISDGAFAAAFYTESRDSTAHIRDLDLDASSVRIAPELGGRLDTLGLRGQLPADTATVDLTARGSLSQNRLRLDTLRLHSARSRVLSHGSVRLPAGPDDMLDDVDLTVRSEPLVLGDLTPFAPTLNVDANEAVTVDARLTGSGQLLTLAADAEFSTGGTLTARADVTPRTSGGTVERPLRYDLSAQIRSLTTSLLGPADPSQNTITASIEGSLQGPALAALDGYVDVTVGKSQYGQLQMSDIALRSRLDDGTADVQLDGALNGTTLTLAGTGRPFDADPSITLTSTVEDLSLTTVAPEAGLDGQFSGSIEIRGTAIATDRATFDVTATLGPSRFAAQPIDRGRISATLNPDQVQLDGSVIFPDGQLALAGRLRRDDSRQFTLDRVHLENVNVAALVGDSTDSRFTGTVRANGQGWSPSTMDANATLSIDEGRYAQYEIRSLTTEARLESGSLTTETEAIVNNGRWTMAATSRPYAAVFSAKITSGQFREVDIGPLLQDTTQSSSLNGTFQGQIEGTSASAMRLDAGLTVDTSRLNRQQISSASAEISLRDGELESDIQMEGPEGSARVSIRGRPFDDVPLYRITSGSFEQLNVGAIAGVPGLTTRLSGVLALRAAGTSLSDLSLDSDLTLQESTVNRAPLTEGQLTASARNGRLTMEGQFSVAGGSLTVSGHLDSLRSVPSYAVRSRARSLDVGALAGFDTTNVQLGSARWSLTGRGTELRDLSASSEFAATALQVDRVQVDSIRATGRLSSGLLNVDTLKISSNILDGRGQGPVALVRGAGASKFDINAEIHELTPLRSLVGARLLSIQEGRVDAHIYGGVGDQRFDGEMTVDGLIYDDVRFGQSTVSFNGQRGREQVFDRLNVEGETGYMSIRGIAANRVQVKGDYDGLRVRVSSNVVLDAERRISLAASFQPDADPIEVQAERLDMRVGSDRWSLADTTRVTVGDHYRVDDLRLQSGNQRIEADGTVSPTGTQSLVVTTNKVRLGGIAPLMGLGGLGGEVTSRLAMTGPATDPQIDGRLEMNLRSEGNDVGTLALEAAYDSLEVVLDAHLTHTNGSVLTADGSIPIDLRLSARAPADLSEKSIRVDATTKEFPINWIDPFLDPATLRSVTGTLMGNVSIGGTLDQPQLSGTVAVANAGAYVTPLETAYSDGSARLRLQDDQITLENGVVRTPNGGTLEVNGGIDFPQLTVGQYDLAIEASDFVAIDTRAYREVVIDGSLRLQGSTRRPTVTGSVDVERGNVYYAEALAETAGAAGQVPLSDQDQLVLEERFGLRVTAADTTTFDFYKASSLDLTVQIQRDMWLRSTGNPEMNVQFAGDLDVQKAPEQDPRIFGTIDVIEGQSTVRQFGQEFEITEGTLTFNGDPYLPFLDLAAVYEQRARGTEGSEVRITLDLSGRPDELTPSLSSDPSMSTRNILSYLATGRPADELFSGDSEGSNLATRVAIGQATNFVENLAASELGLDIVRLDIRPEGVSYLTFGRYFSSRFFASIEQPVVTSSAQSSGQARTFVPDVTLEYQLTDHLLLRSLSGQQSLQLHLLFQYAY